MERLKKGERAEITKILKDAGWPTSCCKAGCKRPATQVIGFCDSCITLCKKCSSAHFYGTNKLRYWSISNMTSNDTDFSKFADDVDYGFPLKQVKGVKHVSDQNSV
jgi:hypothetical protein